MSSKPAWGTVPTVQPCRLADVMSEELVQKMRLEEEDSSFLVGPSSSTVADMLKAKSTASSAQCEGASALGFSVDQEAAGHGKTSTLDNPKGAAAAMDKHEPLPRKEPHPAYLIGDNPEAADDFVLAQLLQKQFDKEYDEMLLQKEAAEAAKSKVSVSYSHLQRANQSLVPDSQSSESEEEESEDDDAQSQMDKNAGPTLTFKRGNYTGKGANIRTKHDPEISGKRNAAKMDKFCPSLNTGDVTGMDVRLSNRVYNQLRQSATADKKRAMRIREPGGADRATAERALDERTREIVFRLIQQDRLHSVSGVVSTGKEAVVLHAAGGSNVAAGKNFPPECAVKVFKTTLNEFRSRRLYVTGDFRFSKDQLKKRQNPRKVVKLWAEKEMMNLKRMRHAGLPCPDPLILRKHVLVMSFIGRLGESTLGAPPNQAEWGRPAPQLKEFASGMASGLSQEDWEEAYIQTVEHLHTLYEKCGLVHADLSEYNLLWAGGRVWIIDVSQAVDTNHPHALEFLLRDCTNVSTFFGKRGVVATMSREELFNDLTGAGIQGTGEEFVKNFADHLSKTQDYEKDHSHLTEGLERTEYPFDHFFSCDDKEAIEEPSDDDDDDDEPDDDCAPSTSYN